MFENVIIGAAGILIAVIFVKLFSLPIRLVFKLVMNTVGGFIVLFIINLFSGFTGIYFAINYINAIVIGIFGLPGIAFLLIARWLLLI